MSRWIVLTLVVATGCSGVQPVPTGVAAPFKAVVVLEWSKHPSVGADEMAGPSGAESPGGGPDPASDPEASEAVTVGASRQVTPAWFAWVENEILAGLEEYQVFSQVVSATATEVEAKAQEVNADLIVRIRIGSFVHWEDSSREAHVGLGILDTAVWITTAIGSWWIPNVQFSTDSDVEVSWRRPRPSEEPPRKPPDSSRKPSMEIPYTDTERLTTGEYRLSFWDRARPWRYPWPYLMSIVIPPVLMPLHDRSEVDTSLVTLAVEDLKREIARRLVSGNLRSAGMPFLFRLEEPRNGEECKGDSLRVQFRYSVEPGFEKMHAVPGLDALRVEVKREDQKQYRSIHSLTPDQVAALNEKIVGKESFAVDVSGLGPGTNLIRFSARTRVGRHWITNTVAIRGR